MWPALPTRVYRRRTIRTKKFPVPTCRRTKDLYFGYQDESNDYAAWWTVNMLWVPVPMYVIEATPKDPYYNYGKQIYEFEPHLFIPGWKQAYNRAGEYWRTILLWIEYTRFMREGKLNVCSDARAAIAVDDKVNRGTVIMADGGLAAGRGQHLDTHYVPVGLVPATQLICRDSWSLGNRTQCCRSGVISLLRVCSLLLQSIRSPL